MDGGTIWNINALSAVQQCIDDGYREDQVILDVMLCGGYTELTNINETSTTIPNYMRKRSWSGFYNGMNALTS